MGIVHSYLRFSDDSQSQGDSLRRQVAKRDEFCRKNGHALSNLKLADLGKSAYRGNKQKALDQFIRAIDRGIVKPGDILAVEAVDRLSRKGVRSTQTLVNNILNRGVHIAVFFPYEKVYSADKDDIGDTIEIATAAYVAHLYSKNLSERISSYFTEARVEARTNGKKPFGIIPAWLEKRGDHFNIKPGAEAIRYIFRRSIEGVGNKILCQDMNATFPALGRSKKWNETFIRNLIRERTVLGEYQPHALDKNGKRQPDGEVIIGYYPAIVDEDTWLAANQAMNHRRREKGPSKKYINLFTGLLWHATDHCPVHITTYQQMRADGRKVVIRRLKSYSAIQGVCNASTATVDLPAFEHAILNFLPEVDGSVFESSNHGLELERKAKQAELHIKLERLQELKSALKGNESVVSDVLEAIAEVRSELEVLRKQMAELAASVERNPQQALEQIRTLNGMSKSPEDRQKLREALKQVVEVINLAPVKLGKKKRDPVACAVEIIFKGGHRRLLLHCNKRCIAYTDSFRDYIPEVERLTNVNKTWLRKLAKAARLLFVPS